ncbi:hypothetical protein [Archangium sp.]|uniref:hypothetical protein n=1 Tax=Archangium sp. TaxID=1872627 RepID=UPI00286A686B|nr:hypothetical protein [Archangium sp.]
MASLPAQALAAAPSSSRKTPARKAPAPRGDFQSALSAAVRLYEGLEYEQALAQLARARALAQGIEQEVAVTLYQGIVQAELGQRVQSLSSFRTGLYLQPDAKLPAQVSPKVARDFEEVRQDVLRDLGLAPQEPASSGDRPVQPQPPGLVAQVEPPPPAPAYVPSTSTQQTSGRGNVLPITLMGATAVAGGAAGFFGLQSRTNIQFAREAAFHDERVSRLKEAEQQAFIANLLFGTASAAAMGALATFLIAGGSNPPPASASAGGTP